MKKDYDGWTVKLEVHNVRDTIKSSNVIGYITGSVEPDRRVSYINIFTLFHLIVPMTNIITSMISNGNTQNIISYIFTKQIRDAWKSQGCMGVWCS